ncbi:MAG: histidine kinase [Flammeovirgaceae bacterium]|nr:histidine kinase [Flammeovirgaceae bacterium]
MSTGLSFWAKLYRYKVHHVVMWLAYWVFWTLLYQSYYSNLWLLLAVIGTYFIFNAASFYMIAYYFFPHFLYKRLYGKFILWSGVLIILLSIGLAGCLLPFFSGSDTPEYQIGFFGLVQTSFISICTMTGLMCGIKLVIEKIKSDKLIRDQDKQRLESELQYLKAQVNPHFLFNAINSIYFLIRKNPDHAAETLIKLSDLLRFQLYDCSGDKISIEKEIEYVKNFIALERMRKSDKVRVNIEIESLSGFEIAPFLLIPFLENAFKYVSNYNDLENFIEIKLSRQGDKLRVNFINTTDRVLKTNVGGIGLKNVKRRLELLYPGKHDLSIRDEDGMYSVDLRLEIV